MSPFCAWKRKGSTDFDFEVVTLICDLENTSTNTQTNISQNVQTFQIYTYFFTLVHIGLNVVVIRYQKLKPQNQNKANQMKYHSPGM